MFKSKNLKEIEDTCTSFNNVSIQDAFAYPHDCFGDVTLLDLKEAEKAITKLFNPSEPFCLFVSNIEDAIDIAEAEIINKALTNIIKA